MTQEQKYNPNLFEVERWPADLRPEERARLEALIANIPEDVNTIIDVGCGDGRLTRLLRQVGFEVMAVDQSATALSHVDSPKQQCSADALPFEDQSYDLVICSEVLEHLPQPLLSNVIAELERVARLYVIITVPRGEDLDYFRVSCPNCEERFHPYGHLHAFTEEDLEKFMDKPVTTTIIESRRRYYHPVLKKLAFGLLGRSVYVPHTVCPVCNWSDFEHHRVDHVRRLFGGLNWIVTRGKTQPGGWFMARYKMDSRQ